MIALITANKRPIAKNAKPGETLTDKVIMKEISKNKADKIPQHQSKVVFFKLFDPLAPCLKMKGAKVSMMRGRGFM